MKFNKINKVIIVLGTILLLLSLFIGVLRHFKLYEGLDSKYYPGKAPEEIPAMPNVEIPPPPPQVPVSVLLAAGSGSSRINTESLNNNDNTNNNAVEITPPSTNITLYNF